MINKSTSLIRRIFWMVSIATGVAGLFIMIGTDLESSNWWMVGLTGFIVFFTGSVLTIIANDPVAFLARFVSILIAFNYMLYRVFKLHTNTTRKCYRLYIKYDKDLNHVYYSAYNIIYDSHPIDTITEIEDH